MLIVGRQSGLQEVQQILVEPLLMRISETMVTTFVRLQFGALNQLLGTHGCRLDRDDLIVVAMNDERWYVEPFQICGEVGFRERLDTVEFAFQAADHPLSPEGIPHPL